MNIPPNDGIAIGTIMSEPRPFEVITGIKARSVVAVVISAGLIRRLAASSTAVFNSSLDVGDFLASLCLM